MKKVKDVIAMIKNKTTFYALSFTWGILMTLAGCIAAAVLMAAGHAPKKWGYCWYFEIGKNWGGLSLGPVFLTSAWPSKHTKCHEHGHSLQNCMYGPYMVVISLMSACRYWYRELKYNRRGLTPPTKYDDAWYEGEATRLGTEFINSLETN
jgi:hypothetical protein